MIFISFVQSLSLSVPPSVSLSLSLSLCVDGGDLDLYIIFANASSPAQEPGKHNYHYSSTSWSTLVDEIEIKSSMAHFCYDCIAYIAVYAYSTGSYSLQASSTGLTKLQPDVAIGGTLTASSYGYYVFFNDDPFAEIKISLTTVSDCYISYHIIQY